MMEMRQEVAPLYTLQHISLLSGSSGLKFITSLDFRNERPSLMIQSQEVFDSLYTRLATCYPADGLSSEKGAIVPLS